MTKIAHNSPSRQNPSELETAIAGALFDLESNTQDLKATLRPLQIVSAREVGFILFSFGFLRWCVGCFMGFVDEIENVCYLLLVHGTSRQKLWTD